jgi:predicted RNA-binding protein with PUA-like domain
LRYWLLKSEPDVYSIDDLERQGETLWDGVRNYQARNYLREMQVGDVAFFYHSNTKPPGIVGLMEVSETDLMDPTQFDPENDYFDPKSDPAAPRWQTVKFRFRAKLPRYLSLDELKANFEGDELGVVRKGTRLSVMPVEEAIAQRLLTLAGAESLSP